MLYGTSYEDILPYANFSFEITLVLLHYPFLFLALTAGDKITEPEKFHRNSHNWELINKMQSNVTYLVVPWRTCSMGLALHPLQQERGDNWCESMTAGAHTDCKCSASKNLSRWWWGHLDDRICWSLFQWDVPAELLLHRQPGSSCIWGASLPHFQISQPVTCWKKYT